MTKQATMFTFKDAPKTSKRLSLRDLPENERPRYRAEHMGLGALSDRELIQLVTGQGYLDVSARILAEAGSLTALARMPLEDLTAIDDVGKASAAAIQAALELGRRMFIEHDGEKSIIRGPADVALLAMGRYGHEEQEHFVVYFLNCRNHVIGSKVVYIGGKDSVYISVPEVFKEAVRKNAAAIILAHNHPSGDPSPSPEDIAVTRKLRAAGDVLEIEVLDHVVVGDKKWVSLKERGLGF